MKKYMALSLLAGLVLGTPSTISDDKYPLNPLEKYERELDELYKRFEKIKRMNLEQRKESEKLQKNIGK